MAQRKSSHSIWKGHFQSYEKSGLTVSAFCHKYHLSSGMFYYWRRRLKTKTDGEDFSFREIQIPVIPSPGRIRIEFSNGVSILLEGDVSSAYVRELAGC